MAASTSTMNPDEFLRLFESYLTDHSAEIRQTDHSADIRQTDISAGWIQHDVAVGAGVGAGSERKFHAALLNFRSVNKKTPYMVKLIQNNELNLFLITETWLTSQNESQLTTSSQNFKVYNKLGTQPKGRGVAIVVLKDGMNFMGPRALKTLNPTTFEHVAANLKHNKWEHCVLFITVYRLSENKLKKMDQGMTKFQKFLEEFQMLLDEAKILNDKLIVSGDFNIWFETDSKNKREFLTLLNKNQLTPHVNGPTRDSDHILDLVISKNVGILNVRPVRTPQNISDHYTVYFDVEDQ